MRVMPRPDNLPVTIPARLANVASSACNWRNGRVGTERNELWLPLNHGQAVAAAALVSNGQLPAEKVWGLNTLNTPGESVWELVYDEPAVPALTSAATTRKR